MPAAGSMMTATVCACKIYGGSVLSLLLASTGTAASSPTVSNVERCLFISPSSIWPEFYAGRQGKYQPQHTIIIFPGPGLHLYAITRRSSPSEAGANSTREKPAFFVMLSSSAKVYASPAGVVASIIMLKAAAIGGVTRSGLGTNSTIAARPPGLSEACTLRMKAVHVGGSK